MQLGLELVLEGWLKFLGQACLSSVCMYVLLLVSFLFRH